MNISPPHIQWQYTFVASGLDSLNPALHLEII